MKEARDLPQRRRAHPRAGALTPREISLCATREGVCASAWNQVDGAIVWWRWNIKMVGCDHGSDRRKRVPFSRLHTRRMNARACPLTVRRCCNRLLPDESSIRRVRHDQSVVDAAARHHVDAHGVRAGHDRHQLRRSGLQPEVAFLVGGPSPPAIATTAPSRRTCLTGS